MHFLLSYIILFTVQLSSWSECHHYHCHHLCHQEFRRCRHCYLVNLEFHRCQSLHRPTKWEFLRSYVVFWVIRNTVIVIIVVGFVKNAIIIIVSVQRNSIVVKIVIFLNKISTTNSQFVMRYLILFIIRNSIIIVIIVFIIVYSVVIIIFVFVVRNSIIIIVFISVWNAIVIKVIILKGA